VRPPGGIWAGVLVRQPKRQLSGLGDSLLAGRELSTSRDACEIYPATKSLGSGRGLPSAL
jgi:hypothetical protein